MGRVIYIGRVFYPSEEYLSKLDNMQQWYRETSISIMIDCKYDKQEHRVRVEELARQIRAKWRGIKR